MLLLTMSDAVMAGSVRLKFYLDTVLDFENRRTVAQALAEAEEGLAGYNGEGLDTYAPLMAAMEKLDRVRSKSRSELPPILGWGDFVPAEGQTPLPKELVPTTMARW